MASIVVPKKRLIRDVLISLFIYSLPVIVVWLYHSVNTNLNHSQTDALPEWLLFLKPIVDNLQSWGLLVLLIILGFFEFFLGLYENKWTKNEKILDIVCFVAPKIIFTPLLTYFSLKLLPYLIPGFANQLGWIPFWYGVFILIVILV
ncbi:MAG: hypothetical protein FGM46_09910 [Ferruginibacter sp.]|nr:hypothetical protein [Ferruginibacter sp.]